VLRELICPRPIRRTRFATGALAVLAFVACASAEAPCKAEPEGKIVAFFAGGEPSREVVAQVAAIDAMPTGAGFGYRLRSRGSEILLTYRAAAAIPGVLEGNEYTFMVDYSPGYPDSSGIVVRKDDELIFAALTDQRPMQHVLKDGIPGFDIELQAAACPSRGRTSCHEALVNRSLRISHRGESAQLHHGEGARLGEFEVRLLTAQSVTYSKNCSDAGLAGVSLFISRAR
jgi:hypothetical protein